MSIASITTFGFGSFSTINLAVSLGYASGVSTADTHDGGSKKRKYYSLKEISKLNQRLERIERDKLASRQALRSQIEKLVRNEPIAEIIQEVALPKNIEVKHREDILPILQKRLSKLEASLPALYEEMRQAAIEARRLRDEDDMKAILLALEYPYQQKRVH
jgi:hypothetical protein